MVRKLILIIMIVLFVGVPCGTYAVVELDADDNGAIDIDKGGWNSVDGSYDGPITIGGTGDSWLELLNNTSLVDDITGKYGIRFSNGVLQQIINGTPSSIGSGGSAVTTQVADPTVGDPTGFYLSTGTTKFWYRDSALGTYDFGTYAFTADPVLYTLTVTPALNGDITTTDGFIDCPDVNCSYDYVAGTTPELNGTPDALYQFDNWTGDPTDTSDTTNPDIITMNAANTVSADFSLIATCTGVGTVGEDTVGASIRSEQSAYTVFVAGSDVCANFGYFRFLSTATALDHVRVVIWSADGLTTHATSDEQAGDGTTYLAQIPFSTPFQMLNGVTYRIGYVADSDLVHHYSTGSGVEWYSDGTYSTYPSTIPSAFSWAVRDTTSAMEIYVKDN